MVDITGQALGFVETMGLVAATEAADAMIKSANVHLVSRQQVGGGLITIIVSGDGGPSRPRSTPAPPLPAGSVEWCRRISSRAPRTTSLTCSNARRSDDPLPGRPVAATT